MKNVVKRVALWALAVLGVLAGIAAAAVAYVQIRGIPKYPVQPLVLQVEVTPARVERGRKLATLSCINCHANPTTHQLTGKKLDDAPPAFGPIYSRNITQDRSHGIGAWTDGDLARMLRTGLRPDGQYVPIYMPKMVHMSDEDLFSVIAFLRSNDPRVAPSPVDPPDVTHPSLLTKFLSYVAFKPLPYPSHPIVAPPIEDRVAHGRYLLHTLDCYACHSADFTKLDVMNPDRSLGYMAGGNTLMDLNQQPILSTNLTFDRETGIGRWSEADFRRALRDGIRPDRSVIRYPMMPMPVLSDDEVAALYAYLQTVPIIHNRVKRFGVDRADPDEGKRVYQKYGCASCHGDNGVGIADLRRATVHYPKDEQLIAWIKNAPGIKSGTIMPKFDGVVEPHEFPPLVAYVKKLGQEAEQSRR
ncbi:MAG: c-type cytochrome [Deltaproteobacteria bacterium]|nr:c-type cytochrome [Deltaproteobacteria bacterium]